MDKETIKNLATDSGFTLRQQDDGSLDLNPYVYDFAERIIKSAQPVAKDSEKISFAAVEIIQGYVYSPFKSREDTKQFIKERIEKCNEEDSYQWRVVEILDEWNSGEI